MAANLDRAESALTAVSDIAYVRAIDSSGNSVRISKADLASVLGDFYLDNKYGKEKINSNVDINLDLFKSSGAYRLDKPKSITGTGWTYGTFYGSLFVIKGFGSDVLQIITPMSGAFVFIRFLWQNSQVWNTIKLATS